MSAKNLLGDVDSTNPNKINLNLSAPNSDIIYDPKTDTIQLMD